MKPHYPVYVSAAEQVARKWRTPKLTITLVADDDGLLDIDEAEGGSDKDQEWFWDEWATVGVDMFYPDLDAWKIGDPINAGKVFTVVGTLWGETTSTFDGADTETGFDVESVAVEESRVP